LSLALPVARFRNVLPRFGVNVQPRLPRKLEWVSDDVIESVGRDGYRDRWVRIPGR
jgi:hypothetical protein